MLFQTRLLMTSVMLLGVAACTTQPLTHTAGSPFITDTQAAPIAFQSLRLEGQTVKGQIRRIGREPVHFGHVDYAVLDARGEVREQGWVEHTAAIRQRQPRQPSLFSIHLQQPLTDGETVRLSYHIGKHF